MSQSLVDRYDDRIAGILYCYDPVVITDRDTRKVGTVNLATDIQPVPQGDLAPTRSAGRHHVVIVGGGFGGLEAANGLAGAPVDITVIDQRNHHIFQPLLYQVATASLAPSEIAWPIRFLMRGRPEVTTLLATVTGVDVGTRRVLLDGRDDLHYDTLVLAPPVPGTHISALGMGGVRAQPEDDRRCDNCSRPPSGASGPEAISAQQLA